MSNFYLDKQAHDFVGKRFEGNENHVRTCIHYRIMEMHDGKEYHFCSIVSNEATLEKAKQITRALNEYFNKDKIDSSLENAPPLPQGAPIRLYEEGKRLPKEYPLRKDGKPYTGTTEDLEVESNYDKDGKKISWWKRLF